MNGKDLNSYLFLIYFYQKKILIFTFIETFDENFYTPEFYEQYLEFLRERFKDIVPEKVENCIKIKYPNFNIDKIRIKPIVVQEKKTIDYYKQKCKI